MGGATGRKQLRVRRVRSAKELEEALAIRMRVFVKEQRVPLEIEMDEDDRRARHFLARVSGKPVGTARLVVSHGRAKIGRMAVLKRYRGAGVGKKLLRRAIAAAETLGGGYIYLHAQVPVLGFYERLGFRATGSVFDEAGIPHRKMVLRAKKIR
jgi:predicted GNAT family N-acyltransferase